MLYERAPTPHWKRGTVEWKEIQMTWTLEEPTRQAQLLAGETHLTELNKDLTDDLVAKGYKLIRSRGRRSRSRSILVGSTSAPKIRRPSAIPKTGGPRANWTRSCRGRINGCGRP